jgi:methionine-rich copper-binding protein CopC
MRRVAVLIASLWLSTFGIASAQAHAELLSMSPAVGSVVTEAPSSVSLTFGEDVTALGSTIVVLDPDGNAMQTGELLVTGASIATSIQPLTVAGTYHVNFRVVSQDGHIVNSSESFDFAPATQSAEPLVVSSQTASPETSAVTSDSKTAGFWIMGFFAACALLAAFAVRRARSQ